MNIKATIFLLIFLLFRVGDACSQNTDAGTRLIEGSTKPSMEMLQTLERIQNQWMKRRPGLWASELFACDVLWTEKLSGMRSPAKYSRRIRETPDHQYLVAENWILTPGDLSAFMEHWGRQGVESWEQFRDYCHVQNKRNRAFTVPQEGLICIWRFFPSFDQAWKTPPFSLSNLSKEELAQDSVSHSEGRVKQFFSDMLLEEILDRDGLGVSLSKTWHFTDNFSRLTANIGFQRRLRLNFNGLYSVFDTFQIRGEVLLGNVIEKTQNHFYSEIGPFLGIKKEVVVIQTGFKSWGDALFSKPFNPRRLPYNEERLRALPIGIRIVYPHQATLALVAKTNFNYFETSKYTQKLRTGVSVKGSVMVSISKEKEGKIILKIGSSLEKLVDAYVNLRPDFDGTFDPLRLLFGSIVKFNFESGRGKLVDLEKEIDLNSPDQLRLLKKALKNGMLLKGFGFGIKSALYFIFHPNQEDPHIHLKKKIPEINWDRAFIGTYQIRGVYSKVGSRPVAFRRVTEMIGDEWEMIDYKNFSRTTGYTISMDSSSHWRSLWRNYSRDLQLHAIANHEFPDDVTIMLLDITKDNHWSSKRLIKFQKNWMKRLGFPLELSADQIQAIVGHSARIGFRFLVSLEALKSIHSGGKLDEILSSETELSRWFKRHRLLGVALRKSVKTENWFWLSRVIYKMIKKGAPLTSLMNALPESKFSLEWTVEKKSREVMVQQKIGLKELSRRQVMEWRWWKENRDFEDIFIDVSLTAEK